MPPAFAARFTVHKLAVLRIVADAAKVPGACDKTNAEPAGCEGPPCPSRQLDALRSYAERERWPWQFMPSIRVATLL